MSAAAQPRVPALPRIAVENSLKEFPPPFTTGKVAGIRKLVQHER